MLRLLLEKAAAGAKTIVRQIRKWLGVSGRSSSSSKLTCVSGRELRIASVSDTIVANRSLDSRSEPRFSKNARFIIETSRYHTPPKWGAAGRFGAIRHCGFVAFQLGWFR